jgi:hypothetical protein
VNDALIIKMSVPVLNENITLQDLGVELRFLKAVLTDLIYSQQRIEKQLTDINHVVTKLSKQNGAEKKGTSCSLT